MNEWAQLAQDIAAAMIRVADAAERIADALDHGDVVLVTSRESQREDESAGG